MSTSAKTTDHQQIKKWTESRKGVPAKVKGTGQNDFGLIRIHFPEYSKDQDLQQIDWKDFFDEFEKNQLEFLYQDKKDDGELSTFHKFIHRGD
jgi:hypothetical protein